MGFKEITQEKLVKSFSEMPFHKSLQSNLKKMCFETMTPIQRAVIPFTFQNKDVMGCSQTGSGKTIAFLAPIINKMLEEGPPSEDSELERGISAPRALILAPTRELSEQIYKEARKLTHKTGIISAKAYGGVPIETQLKIIQLGVDILIATPGRLIDFMKRGLIILSSTKFLVLDEADRMLDMGFEDQLREIVFSSDMKAKEQRTNMMFSATFTSEVREIAKIFMNEYYYVTNNVDQENKANENIEQKLIYVNEKEKVVKLHEILQQIRGSVISN